MISVRFAVVALCLVGPSVAAADGLGISMQQVIEALTAPGEIAPDEIRLEPRGADRLLSVQFRESPSGSLSFGTTEMELILVGPATNLNAIWIRRLFSDRALAAAEKLLSLAAPTLGAPPAWTGHMSAANRGAGWLTQFFSESSGGYQGWEIHIERFVGGRRLIFESAEWLAFVGIELADVGRVRDDIYAHPVVADPQARQIAQLIDEARYADALARLLPLAEAGNHDAQAMLGDGYYLGRGVARNFDLARTWYLKAAQGAAVGGDYGMGLLEGVDVDTAASPYLAGWLLKAALSGHPGAQAVLAQRYSEGRGVPHSNDEAAKWAEVSARLGNIFGQIWLAGMYAEGRGRPENAYLSYYWFSVALARLPAYGILRDEIAHQRDQVKGDLTADRRQAAEAQAAKWQGASIRDATGWNALCAEISCPADLLAAMRDSARSGK